MSAQRRNTGTLNTAAWVGGAALAQAGLLGIWGQALRLDLTLALSVALALSAGEGRALAWSFMAGLAVDVMSCGPLGLNALLNLAAARVALSTSRVLFSHGFAFQAAAAFGLAMAKAAVFDAAQAMAHPHLSWGGLTVSSLGGALAAAALAPVMAWALAGPGTRAAWRNTWFARGNG